MNSPVSHEHLAALSHKQLCRLYKKKQMGVIVKSIPAEEAKVVDRLLQLDDPVRYCEIHSQKDLIQYLTVSRPDLTPDSSWNKDRLLASLGIIQDTPTTPQVLPSRVHSQQPVNGVLHCVYMLGPCEQNILLRLQSLVSIV